MNAYILAAGEIDYFSKSNQVFAYKKITLIESQISNLLILGFKLDKIFLITSRSSSVESNYKINKKKLGIHHIEIDVQNKRSATTFSKAISEQLNPENSLILNADTYFSSEDLEQLISDPIKSSILVERRFNRNSDGIFIDKKAKNCFVNSANNRVIDVPWQCFSGALYLNKVSLESINNNFNSNKSYIEALINDSDISFKIYYRKNKNFSKFITQSSSNLIGGSFAGLTNASIIIKSAGENGKNKLANEIEWLNSLKPSQKKHFSETIDSHISDDHASYSMPYYGYPSMRHCFLTGSLTVEECSQKLKSILEFLDTEIYSQEYPIVSDWVQERHFKRFDERLSVTKNNEVLSNLFEQNQVVINDICYSNLIDLIQKIKSNKKLINRIKPNKFVSVHGDLHLQNILISEESSDFILVDPRGEINGADIFYDIGKLWHSVNGLYDLIHTDIASVKIDFIKGNKFNVTYGPEYLLQRYDSLKLKIKDLLDERMSKIDKDWYLKMIFNEAMHFSTLFNFHTRNDGIEQRAILLYLTATRLCRELLDYVGETE